MVMGMAMRTWTKAVVTATLKDSRLQLGAGSVTSHVVRQAGGFHDHVGNRRFVGETFGPFVEVRLSLLAKLRIGEEIDAG